MVHAIKSKGLILALLAFFPLPLLAQPVIFAKPLSPRLASYDIDARLEAKTRTVTGREVLTWVNGRAGRSMSCSSTSTRTRSATTSQRS